MELDRARIQHDVPDDQLRNIGARFGSNHILAAVEELVPLGRAYADRLPGYDAKLLGELEYVAGLLGGFAAERARQRKGEKEGARAAEQRLIVEFKWVLRQAATTIEAAIATRRRSAGQSDESFRASQAELLKAAEQLEGRVGTNAFSLAERLRAARSLAADERIVGRMRDLQGFEDLPARLDEGIAALDAARTAKTRGQQQAIADTGDQDLLDGLAYLNLKALVRAGRTHFRAIGDQARAALFNLDRLRPTPQRSAPSGQTPPAVP
jgi:hypothetical protein